MAKYKLENSNRFVDCAILNEQANNYIVKFNTGVIKSVNKERVCQLDRIDEGVLDVVRDTAGKFGKKIVDTAKHTVEAVRDYVVQLFKSDGFVFFRNGEEVLPAIHPINAMIAAREVPCVNVIPSDNTIELARNIGISPVAVENFEMTGDYEGAMQWNEYVYESAKPSGSMINMLTPVNEDLSGSFLKKKDRTPSRSENNKIELQGVFEDWNQTRIVDHIINEYHARVNGEKYNGLPLMIWGAPGIGKTAMMAEIQRKIEESDGVKIGYVSISGGSIGPDDFTMPGKIENPITGAITAVDIPKEWLPVYTVHSRRVSPEEEAVLDAIANDGEVVKDSDGNFVIKDKGPGGIFFIDEFSRLSDAGMNALMQTPTSRQIGSNSFIKFGSRWVIVCAANRKTDMSREKASSDTMTYEAASKTRFDHCNFVPAPQDWIDWANTPVKGGNRKNVLMEIVSYIESEVKRDAAGWGDYYEVWDHRTGDVDKTKSTANPRTWEALSDELYFNYLKPSVGQSYPSVSDIPNKVLVSAGIGIIGQPAAERFAAYVSQFSVFKAQDAVNVWTKGSDAKYDLITKQKLNSANIEEYFNKHVFPMLKENYPGGLDNVSISPDAALNFMKFLENCCYDKGEFNLNRFKTISSQFASIFGVDLKSVTNNEYADAANYKEEVVANNELA